MTSDEAHQHHLNELRKALELVQAAHVDAYDNGAQVIAGMLGAAHVIIEAVVEVMEEATEHAPGEPPS